MSSDTRLISRSKPFTFSDPGSRAAMRPDWTCFRNMFQLQHHPPSPKLYLEFTSFNKPTTPVLLSTNLLQGMFRRKLPTSPPVDRRFPTPDFSSIWASHFTSLLILQFLFDCKSNPVYELDIFVNMRIEGFMGLYN